jgi:hypothetical protein
VLPAKTFVLRVSAFVLPAKTFVLRFVLQAITFAASTLDRRPR